MIEEEAGPSDPANSQRELLVHAMQFLDSLGLNRGTSGNISIRTSQGMLITPSGVPVVQLATAMLVPLTLEGEHPGHQRPSSEWRMHRDIYVARPDVNAVVHTHSIHATALACMRKAIPAVHYMVAEAGGDSIRCAQYEVFGSEELSHAAIDALDGRNACLLANHGMVAIGTEIDAAVALAVEVEVLSHQYLLCLQAGNPVLLTPDEMDLALSRFGEYRRQESDSGTA